MRRYRGQPPPDGGRGEERSAGGAVGVGVELVDDLLQGLALVVQQPDEPRQLLARRVLGPVGVGRGPFGGQRVLDPARD